MAETAWWCHALMYALAAATGFIWGRVWQRDYASRGGNNG